MMVLSRLWYVVLALLLGILTYVIFLAVGEYDRRNAVAMGEELASDSQTVGWALQIDARKRLDALLIGAVDKGIQDALQGANAKDVIPAKAREDGRRALRVTIEKIPADFRPDVLFAVDHDGRVVSEVGFDAAGAFPDFELGGYPAVFDALHGYLRDDTWVLGGKAYRVGARPVEADATQPPLGAIVALKAVDKKFAQEISKRTRANLAFFAGGQRVGSAAVAGFDEARFTAVDSDLAGLASDKGYAEGRSDMRLLGTDSGAIYARFVGDAWDLGAGFVVMRNRTTIGGPMGFLSGADDKDKQSVSIPLIAAVVFLAFAIGIGLSVLEHTLPLRYMEKQSGGLRRGEFDYFQVARFRGGYRGIAENVNVGIDRVLEKGGAAARKPADLESILGPVPAQPSMSAFSFPLPDAGSPPPSVPQVPAFGAPPPAPAGPPPPLPRPRPPVPSASAAGGGAPPLPRPAPPRASAPAFPAAPAPVLPPVAPPPAQRAGASGMADPFDGEGPTFAVVNPSGVRPHPPPREAVDPTLASAGIHRPSGHETAARTGSGGAVDSKPGVLAAGKMTMIGVGRPAAAAEKQDDDPEGDEATVVARAPSELLAAASGAAKAGSEETAEWMAVYDELLRTKKQCNEPTDGLSFEKFQNTLRKNRDALVQRHACKKVRFTVYIKDGRASLKATPIKE